MDHSDKLAKRTPTGQRLSITLTFNRALALFYPCFTICLILALPSWPVCVIVGALCCAKSPSSLPASLTFFTACCAVSFTSLAACETRSATCWAYCWTCSGSGRALRSCCQRSFKKRCVFSLRIRRTTEPVTAPAPTPMRSPLTTRFMLQSPFFSEALQRDISAQHCCCSTNDEGMSLLILCTRSNKAPRFNHAHR